MANIGPTNQGQQNLTATASTLANCLPFEILGEIMQHCVGGRGVNIPAHISQPHWTLSRVSSYWRQVALATPQLWNSFNLFKNPNGTFNLDLVEELLRRSRGIPLDISWQWKARNPVASHHHRNAATSVLASTCNTLFREGVRVWRLGLKLHSARFLQLQEYLDRTPHSVFGQIQELQLEILGGIIPPTLKLSDHPLWTAPRLVLGAANQSITFSSSNNPFTAFGTSHLTHITIKGVPSYPSCLYEILRDTPRLVSLAALVTDQGFPLARGDDASPMLHLPFMENIVFRFESYPRAMTPLTDLFSVISTPNLSSLSLRAEGMAPSTHAYHWRHYIQKSIFNNDIIEFLARCPSLTALNLYQCGDVEYAAVLPAVPALQSLRAFRSGYLPGPAARAMIRGEFGRDLQVLQCSIRPNGVEDFMELFETRLRGELDDYGWEWLSLASMRIRVNRAEEKTLMLNERIAKLQETAVVYCHADFISDNY